MKDLAVKLGGIGAVLVCIPVMISISKGDAYNPTSFFLWSLLSVVCAIVLWRAKKGGHVMFIGYVISDFLIGSYAYAKSGKASFGTFERYVAALVVACIIAYVWCEYRKKFTPSVIINGTAMFDYRDGVAWNNTTSSLCGGPGNTPCPGGMGASQAWNRDAIPAEMKGFDCSKAHPAMGNYHHHQNPSAFKLDLNVVSTICNLYAADGLYAIDSTKHSPLIGFAWDGFPIYGAYGYKNVNGTGGIVRMKSSYSLSTNTTRLNGPAINQVVGTQTMVNGYFREDYVYTPTSASTPDFLDEHNGRFCITPEYPNGIYCYFATVDAKWNSAYPYVVGPTFYGVYSNRKVTSVSETTTKYTSTTGLQNSKIQDLKLNIFPNPTSDFIAIQVVGLNQENLSIELFDATGKLVQKSSINAGATNTYLDTRTLYAGNYLVKITGATVSKTSKVIISK
ncbi:MAG: YHYH protein [Sphingobacteriia bacterium]|nr:YHYH protein [Sphingobacteriia bacterium]